jgi:hypothetical protein
MIGPVLLGDLIRDGKLLWLYCWDCFRERDVDPSTIPLPPDVPVPEIGKRMKCSSCGSRKIDSRPELYPGELKHSEAVAESKLHAPSDRVCGCSRGERLDCSSTRSRTNVEPLRTAPELLPVLANLQRGAVIYRSA